MSNAAPLSSIQRVELPLVELPFSPLVGQRLAEHAELSGDLCGEVDSNDVVLLGECGLRRGKLLPMPKAMMDIYWVNCMIFNFAASNVDTLLKA